MRAFIYCDIDGVLHPWPCSLGRMFDPVCITRLENVLRPHDAGVVITSTWRLEWPLDRIRAQLGVLQSYVIDVTPDIDDPFLRYGRYQEVLLHQERTVMKRSRWIAIDDEAGRYPGHLDNVILTNPATGFSETDAARLSFLLGS